MKYLITGGCGFVGSNLARCVIENNDNLCVVDNLSRKQSKKNLEWLKQSADFNFINIDIKNYHDVDEVIKNEKPDVIFHLAGQVAMTTSIEFPRMDFETNALGSFNLLESIKNYSPESIIIYSSTNKVYGDLHWVKYKETDTRFIAPDYPDGFDQNIPLHFQSPYGCSKGAADQYMQDFYSFYGIRTVTFRHSSIYGSRQFATYDQGWIGWFVSKALEIKNELLKEPFTISGKGKQVRDVLHIDDLTDLYFKTVMNIDKIQGKVFNIGGGMQNSLSLLELFSLLENEIDIKMQFRKIPFRQSDQKVFVAKINTLASILNWIPQIDKKNGIQKMIEWTKGYDRISI